MSDAWMAEHKGRFVRRQAAVWWCGDYDCDCTQAEVYDVWENRTVPGWVVNTGVWQGTYHSRDTREDGDPSAEEDLAAYRDSLTDEERDKITWPKDAP